MDWGEKRKSGRVGVREGTGLYLRNVLASVLARFLAEHGMKVDFYSEQEGI